MPYSIWENIAETPWWMYAIFIYFIWCGYLITKPRIVPIKYLFIFPAILVIASIPGFLINFQFNKHHLLISLIVLLLGTPLGWLHTRLNKVKAIKGTNNLYVPGTWFLLSFVSIVLITKFYYQIQITEIASLKNFIQPQYAIYYFGIYSFFIGYSLGRFAYAKYCLKNGPYIQQEAVKS